jgi:hypothetical protein
MGDTPIVFCSCFLSEGTSKMRRLKLTAKDKSRIKAVKEKMDFPSTVSSLSVTIKNQQCCRTCGNLF